MTAVRSVSSSSKEALESSWVAAQDWTSPEAKRAKKRAAEAVIPALVKYTTCQPVELLLPVTSATKKGPADEIAARPKKFRLPENCPSLH